jgi:Domain of unknown function (DUF4124)
MRTILFSLILISLSAGAIAQTVYKTIGPDGKVVYTDQPPTDSKSKQSTLNVPTTWAASPPASTKDAAAASTKSTAEATSTGYSGAKKATRTDAVAGGTALGAGAVTTNSVATAPPKPATDPAIEKAIIGVLGMEEMMKQSVAICLRTLPTSMMKYSRAADGWRDRNDALVAQSRRALASAFDGPQRQQIEQGIQAKNQQLLAPVFDAPTASRIKWCDNSVNEISNGALDVHNRPMLSAPLMAYSAK